MFRVLGIYITLVSCDSEKTFQRNLYEERDNFETFCYLYKAEASTEKRTYYVYKNGKLLNLYILTVLFSRTFNKLH